MAHGRILAASAVVLLLIPLVSGALADQSPPGLALELPVGSEVGQLAPDFALPILDDGTFHLYEEVTRYNATVLAFFLAAS